jgi:membrane fusion protein (multidrug efflux system)
MNPLENTMSRQIFFLKVLVLTLGLVCLFSCDKAEKKTHQKGPVTVEIATVKSVSWKEEVPVTATVRAKNGVMLRAEVEGRITGLSAQSGQDVKKDDLVCTIYPDTLEAQLAMDQIQMAEDKKDFERAQKLVKKNDISREKFDEKKADYEGSKARAEKARTLLDLAHVRAPFDGRLGLLKVKMGDYVKPGDDLVDVQDVENLQVDFSVPQKWLASLSPGQLVRLVFDVFPGTEVTARVRAVESAVNPVDRTMGVRADMENPPQGLLPGAFARAVLVLDDEKQHLTVLRTAVAYGEAGSFVFKIEAGKAKKVPVKTGPFRGDLVSIISGLSPGDRVVFAGRVKLHDGTPVKAAP